MRILLFPLWPILNNQILKLAASTELGQLVSVLCIMVQNHVIKSHENENESTLSKRMNLFPCSVNVCSQFVLKSRAQIEVDSAVINPVARPPIYLIVGYAHRLNLTVAFRSSVMPIRKRLIQLIEE
jgi:hypothetical protein